MVLSTHFFIPLRIPRTALTPLMHLGGDSGSRMSAGAAGALKVLRVMSRVLKMAVIVIISFFQATGIPGNLVFVSKFIFPSFP